MSESPPDIRQAHGWNVTHCGQCPYIHVEMLDENRQPFAVFVTDGEGIEQMYTAMKKMMAEVVEFQTRKQSQPGDLPIDPLVADVVNRFASNAAKLAKRRGQ